MEFSVEKNDENLMKAIVETIAFFDLFSYPLTGFEVWKYMNVKCELSDVLEILENKSPLPPFNERGQIGEKNGFYFLAGREEIIRERMARYNYTDKKFKRTIRLAKIFKFIPWIKMIAVGNIIGAHNLKKESDIDLFFITEARRVWLTRFFCVLIVKILGLRPKPEKMRDKICLSFFISEEAMNLEKLMLPEQKDVYFIYWLAGIAPVYDKDNIYNKFMEANVWLKNYLPNWEAGEVSYRRDAGKSFSQFYRDVVDMLFGGLERRIKEIQLEIMPRQIKDIMNIDSRVAVDDRTIKLHVNDRREEYLEKFKIQKSKCKMTIQN
ncbi:MAG: hypothetical protein PHZ04_04360 [Patescibacteria group bacterium]|nr:hypothetical protein [Patescibacteria group bacterium]MDD5294651.1 hypothetical protein [Patescibacteria group bacterium]MDD5554495.1 hypothetical protein [Patescibacteria group bacterium]